MARALATVAKVAGVVALAATGVGMFGAAGAGVALAGKVATIAATVAPGRSVGGKLRRRCA